MSDGERCSIPTTRERASHVQPSEKGHAIENVLAVRPDLDRVRELRQLFGWKKTGSARQRLELYRQRWSLLSVAHEAAGGPQHGPASSILRPKECQKLKRHLHHDAHVLYGAQLQLREEHLPFWSVRPDVEGLVEFDDHSAVVERFEPKASAPQMMADDVHDVFG